MAVGQVASTSFTGATGTSRGLTGLTCAAGNYLTIVVITAATGNNPVSVASVADNVAGGLNRYTVTQGPASAGAFFSGQNQFSSITVVVCEVKSAIAPGDTITLTLNGNATVAILPTVTTWSGLPAGSVIIAAAAQQFLSVTTTAATAAAGARAGSLAVAGVNVNGIASSASGGYALLSGSYGAWLAPVADGNTSTTFTLSASDPIWHTLLVVIGQAEPVQPQVVPALPDAPRPAQVLVTRAPQPAGPPPAAATPAPVVITQQAPAAPGAALLVQPTRPNPPVLTTAPPVLVTAPAAAGRGQALALAAPQPAAAAPPPGPAPVPVVSQPVPPQPGTAVVIAGSAPAAPAPPPAPLVITAADRPAPPPLALVSRAPLPLPPGRTVPLVVAALPQAAASVALIIRALAPPPVPGPPGSAPAPLLTVVRAEPGRGRVLILRAPLPSAGPPLPSLAGVILSAGPPHSRWDAGRPHGRYDASSPHDRFSAGRPHE